MSRSPVLSALQARADRSASEKPSGIWGAERLRRPLEGGAMLARPNLNNINRADSQRSLVIPIQSAPVSMPAAAFAIHEPLTVATAAIAIPTRLAIPGRGVIIMALWANR